MAIAQGGRQVKIVNMSDGAKIQGTQAKRSDQVNLSKYSKKKNDLKTIQASFLTAREGKNWTPYAESGTQKIKQLKESVCRNCELNSFSWDTFFIMLDTVVAEGLEDCGTSMEDMRMDMYTRVLTDLFSSWYCFTIFYDNIEEVEKVYEKGVTVIRDCIQRLEWPAEFDAC